MKGGGGRACRGARTARPWLRSSLFQRTPGPSGCRHSGASGFPWPGAANRRAAANCQLLPSPCRLPHATAWCMWTRRQTRAAAGTAAGRRTPLILMPFLKTLPAGALLCSDCRVLHCSAPHRHACIVIARPLLLRARRFERPDARQRWDAPLFTLRPLGSEVQMQEQLNAIAAAVDDAPAPQQQAAVAEAAAGGGAREGAAAAADAVAGEAGGEAAADAPAPLLQAKLLQPHVATDTHASKLSGAEKCRESSIAGGCKLASGH